MRIGAHLGAAGPLLEPLDAANKLGLTCFQMFIGESNKYWPFQYAPSEIERFANEKQRTNMLVAVHGNYIVNIAHDGENNKYGLGIRSIKSQLDLCDRMHADFLVMHVGSFKEQGPERGVENLVRACETILESDYETKLLLENSAGGGRQIGHIAMLAEAIRKVQHPKLGLCLDTVHAWGDGHDLTQKAVRDELWQQYGDLIGWLHFNSPDPKAKLGAHLDRHSQPWNKCGWEEQTMIDIAKEWGPKVPLCMECSEGWEYNLQILEEHGM
jgi:deoxyribonuclease-4